MIDLVWNFPLLPEQKEMWGRYLTAAVADYAQQPVESQRPSFRTVDSAMRERAANWLGFPAERTWMTSGGHHGNLNALFASGLAGTRFVLEGASYPGFLDQCRITRTEMTACAIDNDGLLPDALREVCVAAQAEGRPIRGLFTMPTVQNPRGFVTPLQRRQAIVAMAREFGLTIIEDDAYGFMQEDAPPNYAVLAPERAFYVRGLAKSFAPGARTGFLVAPESATAELVTSLRCTATGTDVPQNMAALAMCEDGTLDTLMRDKRIEGARRNREARGILGEAAAPGAASAWHLWVRLQDGVDPRAVAAAMAEQSVLLSSGHWCAVSPEYGQGVRVALGGEVDRERTMEGVMRLAGYLQTA
ncbi:MAG TPA: PLP-dependent aminotransferase family protein [Acidobacteriaceae bacterium]|jgi:DNA-binding transcriptional MocR family regulator